MTLTDREKELQGMIDRGDPLPRKYKLSLFAQVEYQKTDGGITNYYHHFIV